MTVGGWICMSVAVGSVLTLFSWCCFKLITSRDENPVSEV